MRIADSTDLRDYIITFQNLLNFDTCQQIIEWSKSEPEADTAWEGWEVAKSAVDNTTERVTKSRQCEFTMLGPDRGPCWDRIELGLLHILEHYPYLHKATEHTGVSLIKYGNGHKFEEHVDSYGGAPRILSTSILLNTDYEGGELSFWQGQYTSPAQGTGDAIVFPSNFCFPHEVRPVTDGERYVLVVWFI